MIESSLKLDRKSYFNYDEKKQSYSDLRVISQPELIKLKVIKKACPEGHYIDIITLFSLDDKICFLDNKPLRKEILEIYNMNVYAFYAEAESKEKFSIFLFDKNIKELSLAIYQKFSIKEGYDISVSTSNKGIFKKGILILDKEHILSPQEKWKSQKLLINKEQMLERFLPGMPKFKGYSEEMLLNYKKAILLSMVNTGLNLLIVGEPGMWKTEMGMEVSNIVDGAYGDLINMSRPGLVGTVVKNITGSYNFIAGTMFNARDKVLVLDEIYTGGDKQYLNVLNNILANHTFAFSKAGTQFTDNKFYMSLIAMCNPIGQLRRFSGLPMNDINRMFTGDFLSRMHLIIALKDHGRTISNSNPKKTDEDVKLYVQQAKQIKLKDTEPDVKQEISKFVEEIYPNINNARFPKNFNEICQATAKLNFHSSIKKEDFHEAKKVFEVISQTLYQ